MRVHRLRLRAFGPFPGEQQVDFDQLSDAGLFLLHGPTGAGKTSVLDAICFALYGRVPGARAGGRLRSDHADPSVAPEICCEFSAGPRRFEITRSPAWERPKKRGTGTTLEQARVILREQRDGTWETLSTRLDETGQLIDEVLGLGLEQFTKLVLLPQGEFAAFLRAEPEVRRQLLERLFGTDRFAAVQQWLRDEQLGLRREVESAQAATGRLLARADQALRGIAETGPEPPGPLGDEPPADPPAWLAGARALAERAWADSTAERTRTERVLQDARRAREQGQELADRQRRRAELEQRRAELVAAEPEQAARRRRLADAERAAELSPLVDRLHTARTGREATAMRVRRLAATLLRPTAAGSTSQAASGQVLTDADAAALTELVAGASPDGTAVDRAVGAGAVGAGAVGAGELEGGQAAQARLQQRVAELREAVGQLAAAEDDERVLADVRSRLAEQRIAQAGLREGLATADARLAELQERLAAGRREHEELRALAGRREAAEAAATATERALTAAREHQLLLGQQATAQHAHDEARRAHDDARQRWLDLRERRLDGIAAELAAQLQPGASCPVCGSEEHPHPAPPAPGGVDAAAEEAAEALVARAGEALHRAQEALASVASRLAAASAGAGAGGTDPEAAAEAHEQARLALAQAVDAGRGESALAAELTGLAGQAEALGTGRADAAAELAAVGEAVSQLETQAQALQARVDRARVSDRTVAEQRRRLSETANRLDEVLAAAARLLADQAVLDQARAAVSEAAARAGFPGVEDAAAAVLDEPARAELGLAVRRHDDAMAAVTDRLSDPLLVEASQVPAPALAALSTAEELARADDAAASGAVARCETAVQALAQLSEQLTAHLRAVTPLQARYRTVNELARCADGTGGDNARRVSLSAYVLGARLEQVAAVASTRLDAISGGRYSLQYSDGDGRGRGRSGLALRVLDGWTGQERDTSSLSGGESFYTSLALALGLADVVAAEAGGAGIDTLFVDEGFGSLDEETLDEVMDVLDGLRSGGRSVGLVSHVPELRQRIPARLEVIRGRTGSRLSQASA